MSTTGCRRNENWRERRRNPAHVCGPCRPRPSGRALAGAVGPTFRAGLWPGGSPRPPPQT
jgi:hypothetical protein